MYTNRIPEISRINQETRDKDFISISELKTFDDKLNEIIAKFSSVNSNTTLSSQATNIGQLIKQIEYNMADAIIFAEDGTISGYKNKTDPTSGATVPDYGENSYENLITKLNSYYNDFMTLFGNDENVDNWKNSLTDYKEQAIFAFKNKINGIFGRVAEQNAIESKENNKKDYITSDPVKIRMNEIMRLNPDKHSFIRQISVMPSAPNKDVIAFEVGELESNSLVLNMKIQNNDLYYNYNIVIDNQNVHIMKEEHIKLANYSLNIKIYKYTNNTGKNIYVFVMNTTNQAINVPYCFELTGILINGYDFGSSGQIPTDHGYYYSYHEVDNTTKPDYNKSYYVKVQDTSSTGLKTNYVIYSITTDKTPDYNKSYYTKVTLDSGTIRYKENKYLTSFDSTETYYEKTEESVSENTATENQYVMTEYTHLRVFDTTKTYYTKDIEWSLVKDFTIGTDTTDGIVDSLNIDTTGARVFENDNQTLIDGIKYKDSLKYKNVDIDCGELFGNTIDAEKATKSKKLFRLDDGVRFYKPNTGLISKVRRGAKKINGNFAVSLGSKIADLTTIEPDGCIFTTPLVDKSDVVSLTLSDLQSTYKLQLDTDEVTSYDVYNNKINFFSFLKNTDTGKYIDSFGQVLHDHIMFVDTFHIELVGKIGYLLDFMVVCDNISDYDNCCHIYYNTKSTEVILPILRSMVESVNNTIVPKESDWISSATDKKLVIAVNTEGKVLYTDNGITWNKNYKASTLNLKDIYYDNENWIGFTTSNKIYISKDGFFTYNDITPADILLSTDSYKFKVFSRNNWVLAVLRDNNISVYISRDCGSTFTLLRTHTGFTFDNFVLGDYGTTFADESHNAVSITYATFKHEASSTLNVWGNETFNKFSNDCIIENTNINYTTIKLHALICHDNQVKIIYSYKENTTLHIAFNNYDINTTGTINLMSYETILNIEMAETDKLIMDISDATFVSSEQDVENKRMGYIYINPTSSSGIYRLSWNAIVNGKTWTQSNITSDSFNCIDHNDSVFVASSGSGKGLYYSTDGKTWTQSNITSRNFNYIDHNDSVFVVGSDSNKGLYYSTDGKTWTQSNITSGNFNYIDHNDSVFVVGSGSDSGLYYSTDGKTWTQSNITSGYFNYIDHNDSVFVVGSGSDSGLYYSTDGKTWTQSNITSGYFYHIDHNDSVFVVGSGSGLYYSTDGKTWTQSNITSGYFYHIDHNDSVFVVGSGSGLYYSTDGKTWTQSNITSGNFYHIDHNDSVFVVGSGSGLYYSTDGQTWTQSNITSGYFNCIDHNDSVFVVGSGSGLYYSNIYPKSSSSHVVEFGNSITHVYPSEIGANKKHLVLFASTDKVSIAS